MLHPPGEKTLALPKRPNSAPRRYEEPRSLQASSLGDVQGIRLLQLISTEFFVSLFTDAPIEASMSRRISISLTGGILSITQVSSLRT